jgi:hypothetical protein
MSRTHCKALVVAITLTVVAGCKGGGGPFAKRRSNETAAAPAASERRNAAGPSLFRRDTQAGREELKYRTAAANTPASTTGRPTKPQITCPVDGNRLGVDNAPIVTVVNGEPIFVCSRGCEKRVQREPDKYLARVRTEITRRDDAPTGDTRE